MSDAEQRLQTMPMPSEPTKVGARSAKRVQLATNKDILWIGAFLIAVLALASFTGCAIVQPGQVGVRNSLGELDEEVIPSGPALFTPGFQEVILISTRTTEALQSLDLPTKEGITVQTEASILYRVSPEAAPALIRTVGPEYERVVVLPTFRSTARGVSARFTAADLYTSERAHLEEVLRSDLAGLLAPRGIVVEAVLLKSIRLPDRLAASIEDKLRAQQDAQRMTFVLDTERQEAERRRIAAEGIRDYQKTIAEGLNAEVLQFYSYEAFRALATSNNAKVIVAPPNSPVLLTEGR
jgi:prohibitin 1